MANEQLALIRLQNYSPNAGHDDTAEFFRALLQNSLSQEGKNIIVDWILQPRVTIQGVEQPFLNSIDTSVFGCDDEVLRRRGSWWRYNLLIVCIDLRSISR